MPEIEIQIEKVRPRRPGRWSTRLAFRATLMAAMALAAAYVVQTKALPALDRESSDTLPNLPTPLHGLVALRDRLILVPLPALALSLAAIALRPLRPLLAPLAAIAAVLAVAAVVGSLVVSLFPLYQTYSDLAAG